jgi:diguanylate cyclase (GGDEF)-like protein
LCSRRPAPYGRSRAPVPGARPAREAPIRTDDLTRLPLRSAFIEAATVSIDSARAKGQAVSLVIIDVDHFKLINDTYGHLQGDDVLVEVADILRGNLRTDDLPARYAGDEFVALLPDTPADGAREVAERVCAALRGHPFRLRDRAGTVQVTASVGVASFPDHAADYDALFAAADRALYQVKRQGRDGVSTASSAGTEPSPLPLSIERFVGRTEELRTMVRFLEDSTTGRPKVVAVSGEAGVGKTTLLRQLEPEVRLRAGSLVVGRCREADVQPPYAPWAEVINGIRRIDGAPRRAWRELPRLVPALQAEPQPEGGEGSKYMLLEEIAEFIRLAAQDRPLVVVLDDMQWADSASWDTLEYLIPQLGSERLLLCLTMRTEETYGEALERRRRLSRNELFHELTLSRLTREEMKQWIEAAFHRQDVGRELLAFLYRHTEGNPLFVVQVLRTLVDEGAVWYTGDRWEWRPVSELRLPVGVSDLISRRLSRLSQQSYLILTTAAVIGREFDLDLAIEAGAGNEDELLDAVDEGIRHSVLQNTAERGGDRFAFAHGKMAEVLRDSVNPRRLRKLHERVAQAHERRNPDAVAEIATHYEKAGVGDRAYQYALLAADRARRVYAHAEAIEFLRVAERNAATPAHLAEVRVRLAMVVEAVGRYDEAEELCDLAIEWFEGKGDGRRALELRVVRERMRFLLGRPARETLDAFLALDAEAQRQGAHGQRVAVLTQVARCHWRLGDRVAAERAAWDSVREAEAEGNVSTLGDALNTLGMALGPEQPTQAVEIYKRALSICEGLGDRTGQARLHNNMGNLFSRRGEWEHAERELTSAVNFARMAGMPDLSGIAALNLGVVYLRVGEFDRARELFGEALALFAQTKNSERQLYALYNLAHLDWERGEFESAAELYDVASSLAQRIGQSDVEIGALAGAGLSLVPRGQVEAARAAHRAAEERMASRRDWFQGREFVEALRVAMADLEGKPEDVRARFEQALALAEASDAYGATWLTAICAPILLRHDDDYIREPLIRNAERATAMGLAAVARRYEEILKQSESRSGRT